MKDAVMVEQMVVSLVLLSVAKMVGNSAEMLVYSMGAEMAVWSDKRKVASTADTTVVSMAV